MALTITNVTLNGEQGLAANSPTSIHRITLAGDAAYVTGGSANFGAVVAEKLARHAITITAIDGLGLTAGAVTHLVRYNEDDDKLLVYLLSDGTQASNGANLSTVTFDLTLFCR